LSELKGLNVLYVDYLMVRMLRPIWVRLIDLWASLQHISVAGIGRVDCGN
jgi:hypothetical protein